MHIERQQGFHIPYHHTNYTQIRKSHAIKVHPHRTMESQKTNYTQSREPDSCTKNIEIPSFTTCIQNRQTKLNRSNLIKKNKRFRVKISDHRKTLHLYINAIASHPHSSLTSYSVLQTIIRKQYPVLLETNRSNHPSANPGQQYTL